MSSCLDLFLFSNGWNQIYLSQKVYNIGQQYFYYSIMSVSQKVYYGGQEYLFYLIWTSVSELVNKFKIIQILLKVRNEGLSTLVYFYMSYLCYVVCIKNHPSISDMIGVNPSKLAFWLQIRVNNYLLRLMVYLYSKQHVFWSLI